MAGEGEERDGWQAIASKVEGLNVRIARHFEDADDNAGWQPPMVNPPQQPTRQEWLRHKFANNHTHTHTQHTHTPNDPRGSDPW